MVKTLILFYEKWTNRLEYINTTMRAIRKIQTDCSLLTFMFNRFRSIGKRI